MDEPDLTHLGPHFTESPLFIVGVIVTVILLAIVIRLLFNNTNKEYEYRDDD